MQSEDFDNKLREAADQHHPAYDERAWPKMEMLLDKHLPQKKDGRRRIIFFLFLFLFLGGGALLFTSKPWKGKRNAVQTIQKPETGGANERTVAGKEKNVRDETNVRSTNNTDNKNNNSTSVPAQLITDPGKKAADIKAGNKKSPVSIAISSAANKKEDNQEPDQLVINAASNPRTPDYLNNDQQDKNSVVLKLNTSKLADDINAIVKKNEPAGNDHSTTIISLDKKIAEKQEESEKENDIHTSKSKRKKSNSFFISLSGGPDVSAVGTRKFGKIKLLAGAGFGYMFKDRWTIRTGFYTGSKVYTAAPNYYKPPVPPQNPSYLYEIKADCKVYEIPLSLAYNFNPSKRHNLFAAVGLSSFIMKKEIYDYQYKYSWGQPWTYRHTEENRNKHYFSVLALSGGYEYKINKIFSVMGEPYIKIPLTGIGYGKVKLNSAGIAVTVKIKPFQ